MKHHEDAEDLNDARILAGCSVAPGLTGVYRSDGEPCGAAALYAGKERKFGEATPDRVEQVTGRRAGEYLYGGVIFKHFGHLLLETFSRLTLFLHGDLPIIFLEIRPSNLDLFWKMVDTMGLPRRRIVVLDRPTIIERLHVVPPGFRIRRSINVSFVEGYAEIGARIARRLGIVENSNSVPVYLSRAGVNRTGRHYFGEALVEAILARHGIEVVRPEDLAFQDQVALWLTRRTLGGFVGSAFHPLLFASGCKTLTYLTTTRINPNFRLIESLKDNSSHYVKVASEADLNRAGSDEPFLLSRDGVMAACRAMGVAVDPDDVPEAELAECRAAYRATLAGMASGMAR